MFGSFLVSNESPRFLPRHILANPSRGEPTWKPYLKMRITGTIGSRSCRIRAQINPRTTRKSESPSFLPRIGLKLIKLGTPWDSDGFYWFPIPGTPQNYAIRRGATAALWFGRLRCLWHLGHRATEPGPHGQRFEPPVAPWSRCFFCVLMVFLDITTVWLICFLEII